MFCRLNRFFLVRELYLSFKVKKDDAEGLAALLDNLEEGENWQDGCRIAVVHTYFRAENLRSNVWLI